MDGSCPYGIRCTFVHDSDVRLEKACHHVRRSSLDTHCCSNSSRSSNRDNGDFGAIVPYPQVKQLYYNNHLNNTNKRKLLYTA